MERVLVLRRYDGNWEVRVVRRRDAWWKRWIIAWRERRAALQLAELDERTLKDIGLDPSGCNPLAPRIHAVRDQESRRMAMARLGLM